METLLVLVMMYEGFSPVLYADGGFMAIGYGHQVRPSEYKEYRTGVTMDDARSLLIEDLMRSQAQVLGIVKTRLNRNQIMALTSLAYNIGVGRFKRSRGVELLNRGMIHHAAIEFFDGKRGFVKSGGKVLKGLQRRRKAEARLFWTPRLD